MAPRALVVSVILGGTIELMCDIRQEQNSTDQETQLFDKFRIKVNIFRVF